jgi:adenosylcobyric acid synthase
VIDAEDSLAVPTHATGAAPRGARIAIVRLPAMSNATDFRRLTWADWIGRPSPAAYDFIIIPGSKHTIADLRWLADSGLADWIRRAHRGGATIIGICGGFQMLGRGVADPDGMESGDAFASGLGLIPADTRLARDKTTRVVTATTRAGTTFRAYEIHLGLTQVDGGLEPFARLDTGEADGVHTHGIIGTYLHGALEDPAVCREIFGVDLPQLPPRAEEYRKLAAWLGKDARGLDTLL